MNSSLDLGAFVLLVIYAAVLIFLIYLLFDIKNIYGRVKTQKYVFGPPEHEALTSSEGIIEVRGDEVAFRDLSGGRTYFSIPLERITSVSTDSEAEDSSNGIINRVSSLFNERNYLFIEFRENSKWHKLQFSAHKASSVNDEVKEEILEAKNRK
jgi:hypothetical protein